MGITRQSKILYGAAAGVIAASGVYVAAQRNGANAALVLANKTCSPENAKPLSKSDAVAVLDGKADGRYYQARRLTNVRHDGSAVSYIKYDGAIYESDGKTYTTPPLLGKGDLLFKGDKGYLRSSPDMVISKVDPKSDASAYLKYDSSLFSIEPKALTGVYQTRGNVRDGKAVESRDITICTTSNLNLPIVDKAQMVTVLSLTPVTLPTASPTPNPVRPTAVPLASPR